MTPKASLCTDSRDKLRSERDELRSLRDQLHAEVAALRAKVAELEKDKARLDWLFDELSDSAISDKTVRISHVFALRVGGCHDYRTAIDVVMKKGL